MVNLTEGIDSLTNFKRQTADYLKRLRKSGQPLVLTVNGQAEFVVQNAAAYQELLDSAARADKEEILDAIREGLADVEAGRTQPARGALKRLAKKYGIPHSEK